MNNIWRGGCTVVLVAGLAGCGGISLERFNPWAAPVERAQTLPSDAIAYACDGGRRLVVRHLTGDNAVMIVFKEREFRLDAVTSSSGPRYSNGSTTLHIGGGRASLVEDGATTYANCSKAAA